MNQSSVNPYEILAGIVLFFAIFSALIYGAWKLFKLICRVVGLRFKKLIIEPANDADDDFGVGI